MATFPVPPATRPAALLLGLAHEGITSEARATEAHLAALRAAAAVLACRTSPAVESRTRPRSVWVLLAQVAPELTEWAQFFAAGAAKRAAAEAGLPGVVSQREADDLLRDAGAFVQVVETTLIGALPRTG
jgi:hypothetical protein